MKQLGMEDESTARRSLQDHYISINTARQALSSSYQNLQNVADYCEKNYMEASDKQKALQDTMSLVTQTLASVASQIVVASGAVVCMLEEQNHILLQEDRKLCFISQLVDIHSEKVSRQKIGSLTTRRRFPPTEKILNVEKLQRQTSYTRHPLNFTSLDNVGNGIIDSDSQFTKTGTMSRRASSKSLTQKPGSLGRSSRANTPILTPLIPEGKFTPPPTPPVVNVPSPVSPVFSCSSSFPPPLSANDPYGVNQSGLAGMSVHEGELVMFQGWSISPAHRSFSNSRLLALYFLDASICSLDSPETFCRFDFTTLCLAASLQWIPFVTVQTGQGSNSLQINLEKCL
uniref:Abl-interactor homeo-domain homologous domain-containing protein n=1 Tax=Leptobrachium leishanense TaxID=445787 RepID=A0A8C5QU28_9ANUR